MPFGAWRLNGLAKTLGAVVDTLAAIDFGSGNNGYESNPNGSITNNLSDGADLTVAFWFKTSDTTNFKRIFYMGGGNPNDGIAQTPKCIISKDNNNRWQLVIQDVGGNNDYIIRNTTAITDGNWHHAHIAVDSSSSAATKFYLDGSDDTNVVSHNGQNIEFSSYTSVNFGFEADRDTLYINSELTQFWWNPSFENDNSKFYDSVNNKAVDLGTDGTGTGLSQPAIFHTGNTSNFTTLGGDTSQLNYTLSEQGTVADSSAGPPS